MNTRSHEDNILFISCVPTYMKTFVSTSVSDPDPDPHGRNYLLPKWRRLDPDPDPHGSKLLYPDSVTY